MFLRSCNFKAYCSYSSLTLGSNPQTPIARGAESCSIRAAGAANADVLGEFAAQKKQPFLAAFFGWEIVDSNHRRHCQQIYSLSPLATREISHALRAGGRI